MEEMRYIAPTGMVGSGFVESSFRAGLEREPAFIGCDGGSTDDGPYQLGAGGPMFAREACKRDLRIMLLGARSRKIPLLIGSAGGAGADAHVQWTWAIVEEIARAEGLHFRAALIRAEQDKGYLVDKLRAGRVRPLDPAPPISEAVLQGTNHIVGMMGIEPFLAALDGGAEVVIAGRASDTSMFAALPVHHGFPAGLAWHAAKILECGAAAVTHRFTPDGMLCTLRPSEFIITPLNPRMRCTPVSVAAHTLYENADPYLLYEPGGVLDTSHAVYQAETDRAVRVCGSEFREIRPYTIKLEGSQLVGYQSLVIGGVRDPVILEQLDSWLSSMHERIVDRINSIFGRDMSDRYHMSLKVYGKNGVMGAREPEADRIGHEVCLLLAVTAESQEVAQTIAASAGHIALHHPVPQWQGLISALAFPVAPHVLDRGPVYRFTLNHVVEVEDPLEMFPITYLTV